MADPVFAADEVVYDRASIVAHMRMGNMSSPVSGKILASAQLRPNASLKAAIDAYWELKSSFEKQLRRLQDNVATALSQNEQCVQRLQEKVAHLEANRANDDCCGGVGLADGVSGGTSLGDAWVKGSARSSRSSSTTPSSLDSASQLPEQRPHSAYAQGKVCLDYGPPPAEVAFSAGFAPRSARNPAGPMSARGPPKGLPKAVDTPRQTGLLGLRGAFTPRLSSLVTPRVAKA